MRIGTPRDMLAERTLAAAIQKKTEDHMVCMCSQGPRNPIADRNAECRKGVGGRGSVRRTRRRRGPIQTLSWTSRQRSPCGTTHRTPRTGSTQRVLVGVAEGRKEQRESAEKGEARRRDGSGERGHGRGSVNRADSTAHTATHQANRGNRAGWDQPPRSVPQMHSSSASSDATASASP